MALDLFLNFNGNCREAVTFYSKVFGAEMQKIMTFGEAPPSPDFPLPPEAKNLIMYTFLQLRGTMVMFSDCPPGTELKVGNNISISITAKDEAEARALFTKLAEGGDILMPLGKTFWSPCYGYLVDKFGTPWQLSTMP